MRAEDDAAAAAAAAAADLEAAGNVTIDDGSSQTDQNGSGAEGSAEEFVRVGFTGRAQSAASAGGQPQRRGRAEEGERDFSRRRVPQASPRAQPYTAAAPQQGVSMEHMFQQVLTTMPLRRRRLFYLAILFIHVHFIRKKKNDAGHYAAIQKANKTQRTQVRARFKRFILWVRGR